jgi:hypothetical protein
MITCHEKEIDYDTTLRQNASENIKFVIRIVYFFSNMILAFFQDFLLHLIFKVSRSSITHGRGRRFSQVAENDIPSLEKASASFKKLREEKSST